MGAVAYLTDRLQNLVAGLGTGRDKAASSFYAAPTLTDAQIMNAYRGAWLPRKIVDIPALDATRKWRSWQASAEQITAIEAEERRLGLRRKTQQALTMARLQGGSALLAGTGAPRPDEPLEVDAIGRGGLRYVTLLNRRALTAGPIEQDPDAEGYGRPTYYQIQNGRGVVTVHPSRLAVFHGAPVPDPEISSDPGWGESVLLAIMEAIQHADSTSANVASLVFEAKVDVVRVENLMQNLAIDPKYEALMLQRFQLAATGKGINGMLVLDKNEEYDQKSASFATLPDIMDRFYQAVAGAADIPLTRLFGASPGGLNSTGDSDERLYYDRIQAHQELDIAPALSNLDEAMIRSALGERPKDVHYVWTPLRQKTEKEIADIGKVIADTVKTLGDAKLFSEDVLAKAGSNALIEAGALPGLESAIDEFGLDREEEDDVDVAAATLPVATEQVSAEAVADAAPRPLYVRRDVLNGAEIVAWAKRQGFKSPLPASDLHVTIAFSRAPVDWMAVGEAWSGKDGKATINAGGPRVMERFGKAVVLLFASEELTWRHEAIIRAGASWDHEEYQPHVTISWEADGLDLAKVEPFRGVIELGPEIFEDLDEDWQSGVSEE